MLPVSWIQTFNVVASFAYVKDRVTIGLFQLGDGTLLALWSAVFASTSETNEMWKICAEEIIEAKCGSIYESSVHFRDRHTGGKIFEDALQISKGMYCVPHLDRNIRQHKGTQADKALEKNFPTNALFYLQASPTAEDFKERLQSFGKRYPNTAQYIQAIDPYKWVYYAQVYSMFCDVAIVT
jgi:hypothetical protein